MDVCMHSSPDAMTLISVIAVEESGWSDKSCLKRVRGAVAAGYLRIQLPPLSTVVKLVAAAEISLPLGYSTAMPTTIRNKETALQAHEPNSLKWPHPPPQNLKTTAIQAQLGHPLP